MEIKNILTTIPLDSDGKNKLRSCGDGLEFTYSSPKSVTREMVEETDAIIGNVPPRFLKDADKLKLLQLSSAGTDGYTEPGVMPPGAKLVNSSGAYGLAISEHMLAMLLTLIKKINLYCKNMEESLWRDEGRVTSIDGSTTLVVGFGDIGGEFARKMSALGSRVIGIRRNKTAKPEYLDGLFTPDKLDELLPNADIVACSLPGTKDIYRLFDRGRVERMKDGAIFMNVGRGNLIETEVLLAALNSGKLGGACIDVTDPEPLPKESALWKAPNLILTPHISGWYHLDQTLERIIDIAAYNLKAVVEGTPIKNEVDFNTGYRKFVGE